MNQKKIGLKLISEYLTRLFPICRSLTGDGNRETLKILQEIIPLKIKEYPSGKNVFDWVIPEEWQIKDAWIKDKTGIKIVDFNKSNLHVVNYSSPIEGSFNFSRLKKHLHIHPEIPNAIPYRTSYYKKDWGFCVTHEQYDLLKKSNTSLNVKIDSNFKKNGSLTIGELLIKGKNNYESLISTYICHPSLANDNLSGTLLTALLAKELLKIKNLKRSYRFIWVPETIGAIAYCAYNKSKIKKIDEGLVLTTVGGPGPFAYKQSYDSHSSINSIIEDVFEGKEIPLKKYPFDIFGSDERQFSSQGFKINMASITKDKYYEYPFYHTSLDNLNFVKPEYIKQSLDLYKSVIKKIDGDSIYKSKLTECEVMLSKHDLYPKLGGSILSKNMQLNELNNILWLLNLSNGRNGIHGISKKTGIDRIKLKRTADKLVSKGLMDKII